MRESQLIPHTKLYIYRKDKSRNSTDHRNTPSVTNVLYLKAKCGSIYRYN
jgi:hypothetical protein